MHRVGWVGTLFFESCALKYVELAGLKSINDLRPVTTPYIDEMREFTQFMEVPIEEYVLDVAQETES